MQLKLAKKKEINEDVLRMIIQYGLGFASRVKNLENKEIEDWKEDKLYEKGAKVLYNNYLWVAKVTNQSSTWNESYWKKIGDDLELIEKSDIEAMLNLTDEQLKTLQSLILDSSIELSHVWSSSKTYGEIQNAIKKGETFTLQELAKKTGASYKIATTTADMTSTEYLYLLANANNAYDIYALIDGTAQKIGDTTINLSQFYTKTECDNTFVKKTDADGKFALITTVDGINTKVGSDTLNTTAQTTTGAINELNSGKVNKTDILDTIDNTCTNDTVLSAKGAYDIFNQKCDKINLYELKDSKNNNKTKHMIIDIPSSHSISGKTTRLFFTDNISSIGFQIWNGDTLEKDYRTPLISPNHIYIVPTTLTPVSSKVNFTNVDSSCNYMVVNGICYVNIWSMNITSDLNVETIFSNLPTAKASSQFILSNDSGSKTVGMGWIGIGTQIIQCNAKLETGSTKSQGYARFLYPVDENWIPS